MKNRLLAMTLAGLLLAPSLVACGGAGNSATDETKNAGETVATETAVETEVDLLADIPTGDYDGYEFSMLNGTLTWAQEILEAEALTGNVLNDAVFNRNRAVEKDLNIKFKVEEQTDTTAANTFRNLILAGDDAYDASFQMVYRLAKYGADNLFYDLYTLEELNFDKPWWDVRSRNFYELDGHLFWAHTDTQIEYYEGLWSCYFNKNMLKDLGLETPYTYVKNGTWTIDKLSEMIENVGKDLNADGVMNYNDQYGLVTHRGAALAILHGMDGRAIVTDDTKMQALATLDDRLTSVIEKAQKLYANKNLKWNTYEGDKQSQNEYFIAGNSLFLMEVLGRAQDLRIMDDDFGIVPYPKFDEAQTDYISYISPSSSALFIPVTTSDTHRTATVMEVLAAYSYDTVLPAYYDTVLQGKTLRDNESEAMLDIMFSSVECELGYVYQWSGIQDTIINLITNDGTIASTFESSRSAVTTAIASFKENLDKLAK